MSDFIKDLEEEATAQLSEIRAYRAYQGQSPEYKQRAKIAIGIIGAYVRLRATMANERSNDLISMRMMGLPPGSSFTLPSGSDAAPAATKIPKALTRAANALSRDIKG